jgi:hypothetical protein
LVSLPLCFAVLVGPFFGTLVETLVVETLVVLPPLRVDTMLQKRRVDRKCGNRTCQHCGLCSRRKGKKIPPPQVPNNYVVCFCR